jgi:hypothetical protein
MGWLKEGKTCDSGCGKELKDGDRVILVTEAEVDIAEEGVIYDTEFKDMLFLKKCFDKKLK